MKYVVLIPTYNEVDNIAEIIALIRSDVTTSPDILVIDSNSPDGTASLVQKLQVADPQLYLLKQPQKRGLGDAYSEAIQWAIGRGYDGVVTMDADFSHSPVYINDLVRLAEEHDYVIGSRYISGGALNAWPLHRRLLSRFANWFAKTATQLPVGDLTSGFQFIRTDVLRRVFARPIETEGYAFLIELKYRGVEEGAAVAETPIVFSNRTRGYSKISKMIILESFLFVLALSFKRRRG